MAAQQSLRMHCRPVCRIHSRGRILRQPGPSPRGLLPFDHASARHCPHLLHTSSGNEMAGAGPERQLASASPAVHVPLEIRGERPLQAQNSIRQSTRSYHNPAVATSGNSPGAQLMPRVITTQFSYGRAGTAPDCAIASPLRRGRKENRAARIHNTFRCSRMRPSPHDRVMIQERCQGFSER